MTRQEELEIKLVRVRGFMEEGGYDGALFASDQGFAWIACGAADLVEHTGEMGRGFANVLVTPDEAYLIASNIEMPRLLAEEVGGLELRPVEYPWTDGGAEKSVERVLGRGRSIASDTRIDATAYERDRLALLRTPLTDAEIDRFRILCARSAEAMTATIDAIRPGMNEIEIQTVAGREILARDAFPSIILVGTDERIMRFRHPVPTAVRLERYCMVVMCLQRWGLVSSLTRLVHFGDLPGELRRRYDALLDVEHALIAATRPGEPLHDIFSAGEHAYAAAGFPGEERKHFQGGTCGYYSREQELSPRVDYRIREGEVFAHNPSITGVKVEDTILVRDGGYDVLTEMVGWPSVPHTLDGHTLVRPEILVK